MDDSSRRSQMNPEQHVKKFMIQKKEREWVKRLFKWQICKKLRNQDVKILSTALSKRLYISSWGNQTLSTILDFSISNCASLLDDIAVFPFCFFLQPASKQLYDDETTSSVFGLRSITDLSPSPSPSPCSSDRPPLGWSSNNSSSSTATSATIGPPVAEKPRWHLGRRTPAHFLPLDVTGTKTKYPKQSKIRRGNYCQCRQYIWCSLKWPNEFTN